MVFTVGKSPRMINNSRKQESGVPGIDLPRSVISEKYSFDGEDLKFEGYYS
jgi:hypothetical protein